MLAFIMHSIAISLLSGIVWGAIIVLAKKSKKYADIIIFGSIIFVNPYLIGLMDLDKINGLMNIVLFIIFYWVLFVVFAIATRYILEKIINILAKNNLVE